MVDYTYFQSYQGAVIPETAFSLWETKAVQYVRQYTHGNIDESKEIPTEVKNCVCDVATIIYNAEQNYNNGVSAEKDGQWSVNYENSDLVKLCVQKEVRNTIKLWLADTGLLFSGV